MSETPKAPLGAASGYATATNPRAYEVVPMPGDARYWWIVRREDNLALSTTGLFSRSLAVTFAKELNKLHDAKSHNEVAERRAQQKGNNDE